MPQDSKDVLDYSKLLSELEAAVGGGNLHVRIYSPAHFTGHRLLTDFVHALLDRRQTLPSEIEPLQGFNYPETSRLNPTPGAGSLELLRQLNIREVPHSVIEAMFERIAAELPQTAFRHTLLEPELEERIRSWYSASNEHTRRHYTPWLDTDLFAADRELPKLQDHDDLTATILGVTSFVAEVGRAVDGQDRDVDFFAHLADLTHQQAFLNSTPDLIATPESANTTSPRSATLVNGVPMPPNHLIFMDSSAETGLAHGKELLRGLRSVGANVDDGLLLDIGCGYGRLAYGLIATGFQGSYVGVDIRKKHVAWLNDNVTPLRPDFTFVHDDMYSDLYNPAGSHTVTDYGRILKGDLADTVILFSVFTHMYGQDIANCLEKIREVMHADSKLLFTCFLFDGEASVGIGNGEAARSFPHVMSDHCRYDVAGSPLSAIAYSQEFIEELLDDAGFDAEIHRGSWSHGEPRTFWQDGVLCRPR